MLESVLNVMAQISAPLFGLAHRKFYRIGNLVNGSYRAYIL
jgi:hypothetical protein